MTSQTRWESAAVDSSTESDSRTAGDTAASGNGAAGGSPDMNPLDPLFARVAELRSYAEFYLETRADQMRVILRKGLVFAALAVVALIAVAAVLVAAVVQLLSGIAHGIGSLLGDRLWAGELITSLLVLGGGAAVIYLGVSQLSRASRKRLTKKYDRRRSELQSQFGRDLPNGNSRGKTHV